MSCFNTAADKTPSLESKPEDTSSGNQVMVSTEYLAGSGAIPMLVLSRLIYSASSQAENIQFPWGMHSNTRHKDQVMWPEIFQGAN